MSICDAIGDTKTFGNVGQCRFAELRVEHLWKAVFGIAHQQYATTVAFMAKSDNYDLHAHADMTG